MTHDTPPRVLGMVLKGYPRISETFISNEIRLLEEMGYEVHILSMRKPREAFSHASVAAIRARVDYMPSTLFTSLHRLLPPNLVMLARRPGRYRRALALMWRRFKRTRNPACIKHLLQGAYVAVKLLPRSRQAPGGAGGVGHLHAQFAHSPTSVAMYAALFADLPFSFTAHAKDIYTQDPEQLAEKMAAARFVVTCTEYNKRHLEGLAARHGDGAVKPVHRVYHGIDLSLFAAPGQRPAPKPPYRVMTVARLVAKKGLPTVLQALKLLREQGLDLRYTLIGEGDERPVIEAMVRDLGLADITTMTGAIPHEQVLEHYREADCFALGCRVVENGDRDGVPNVLVEALAMGVPVAVSEVSAIPELIVHQETGLLVPCQDHVALAEAVRRLLNDSELRGRVIPQGAAKVREDFDNRRCIRQLAAVYRDHGVPGPGHGD